MFKRFQTPYYSNISAKFMLKAFDYGILCFPSGDSFFVAFPAAWRIALVLFPTSARAFVLPTCRLWLHNV